MLGLRFDGVVYFLFIERKFKYFREVCFRIGVLGRLDGGRFREREWDCKDI